MTPSVPGVPTQLAALVGIVLAWIDPNHAIPAGITQGVIVSGLGLVIAILHAVQAYHRATFTPPVQPGAIPPASTLAPPPPPVV